MWKTLHFYHLKKNYDWFHVLTREYNNYMNQDASWDLSPESGESYLRNGEVEVQTLWRKGLDKKS